MNRRRFQKCFFKLVLLRNMVETKVHKETMVIYKAFEKLVKNSAHANGRIRVITPENGQEYVSIEQELPEMSPDKSLGELK